MAYPHSRSGQRSLQRNSRREAPQFGQTRSALARSISGLRRRCRLPRVSFAASPSAAFMARAQRSSAAREFPRTAPWPGSAERAAPRSEPVPPGSGGEESGCSPASAREGPPRARRHARAREAWSGSSPEKSRPQEGRPRESIEPASSHLQGQILSVCRRNYARVLFSTSPRFEASV